MATYFSFSIMVFVCILRDVHLVSSGCGPQSSDSFGTQYLLAGCNFAFKCSTLLNHNWCFLNQPQCVGELRLGGINISSARSSDTGKYVCCKEVENCCDSIKNSNSETIQEVRDIIVVGTADLKCASINCNVQINQGERQLVLEGSISHDGVLEREPIMINETKWHFLHPSTTNSAFQEATYQNLQNLGLSNVSVYFNPGSSNAENMRRLEIHFDSDDLTILNNTIFRLRVNRDVSSFGTGCSVMAEELYLNFTVTVAATDVLSSTASVAPTSTSSPPSIIDNLVDSGGPSTALSPGQVAAIAVVTVLVGTTVVLAAVVVTALYCSRHRRRSGHGATPNSRDSDLHTTHPPPYISVDIKPKIWNGNQVPSCSVPPSTPSESLSLRDCKADSGDVDSDAEIILPDIDAVPPINC